MPRFQNTLSICLGLVAIGSLLYAWQLHAQLAESEDSFALIKSQQSRLQKSVATMEKDRLTAATLQPPTSSVRQATPVPTLTSTKSGITIPPRKDFTPSLAMQKVMLLERRSNLDVRFAALFRQLKLPPDQLEKFKDLLIERQIVANDVYESARKVGGSNRDNRAQLQTLVAESEAQIDKTIEDTFGPATYQQYKYYEQSAPQRSVVSQVERRLSYSGTPLTVDQSDQLVALLASSPTSKNSTMSEQEMLENGPRFRSLDQIPSQTLNQSLSFLSSTQVAALHQLRAEAEQRAQLRQQEQAQVRAQTAHSNANQPATTQSSR